VTHAIVARSPRVLAPEAKTRVEVIKRSLEDHMIETHSAQAVKEAVPNTTGRICATPGCKRVLAYNNTYGLCGECRERQGRFSVAGCSRLSRSHSAPKKTNGHNGAHGLKLARPAVVSESAAPAKPNGADHHHSITEELSNGIKANAGLEGTTSVESRRLDLVLAAIPREDKVKLVSAWLAGTL
jgi:hypothetical protein